MSEVGFLILDQNLLRQCSVDFQKKKKEIFPLNLCNSETIKNNTDPIHHPEIPTQYTNNPIRHSYNNGMSCVIHAFIDMSTPIDIQSSITQLIRNRHYN